ncbi:YheC/YheD family protein [Paenibacillus tyrfis]|uniref:ATP-grasp domain-containing protein n=1 Tax=Paenibacillus tyrfis TaxID=1501230 RepID=A0A081NW73_9BACL|nr:YheC/YheD family protein [Paenibacillus tyrfis]KEQ22696.1 hypothetical protein ET33_22615 [Paenibacillus tyrfis]
MSSKWDPSKWVLHRLYSKHAGLRKRLPPTSILTPASLSRSLKSYGAVYIKGKNQHTGSGIIKAWKTANGYRFVKERGKRVNTKSIHDLYYMVRDGRPSRSVLVQKAIDLASIKGRPFSIRLMLMRDRERKWKYAGMLAKVSGKGSIISNVRRGGGYATTIDKALAQSLNYGRKQIKGTKRRLIRIGFETIRHATKSGYLSHETGLDLGIDKKGKIWIIEVNLVYPSYGLFNKIKDKTFYRKIKRLAAAYRKRRKD